MSCVTLSTLMYCGNFVVVQMADGEIYRPYFPRPRIYRRLFSSPWSIWSVCGQIEVKALLTCGSGIMLLTSSVFSLALRCPL